MDHETAGAVPVVYGLQAESQERRARRLFDEMARNIGREAVNHLKTMYPAALAAVSRSAETSLTNHVRNDVNWRMRPLLMAMIAMHREWEEELDQPEPTTRSEDQRRNENGFDNVGIGKDQ